MLVNRIRGGEDRNGEWGNRAKWRWRATVHHLLPDYLPQFKQAFICVMFLCRDSAAWTLALYVQNLNIMRLHPFFPHDRAVIW